ncbi:alkanesulfonate monooxygenase, partial [Streptomyces sp. SID10244]|nr:alkanesulfonate monooxygenase [Streptomyces sp. SID10244]
VDIGVDHLLIRGYDPFADVVDWGRELIPLVRAGVAERSGSLAAAR